MACGTPVVCAQNSSLPEAGGNAALLADVSNPQLFAQALHRAFIDEPLRQELIDRGIKHVTRFSWKVAAQDTLKIYRHASGR